MILIFYYYKKCIDWNHEIEYKCIEDEYGTPDEYCVMFEGNCKWGVDAYCTKREDLTPFNIPDAPDDAMMFGEKNWYIPQFQKPILFGVEFICNSADVEDYDPSWYGECGGNYEHYAKNGAKIYDDCPEELYIKPSWLE